MDNNTVAIDTVVDIHYSLKLDDGKLVESSAGGEPLTYLHGHGALVPGLEEQTTGKTVGDRFSVSVPAEEGYGMPDAEAIQQVPRTAFPDDVELEVGLAMQASTEDGDSMLLRVVELGDENVTVDFNHPLAGETLHFEIEILAVRVATQEEIKNCHAHDDDCGHDHG
ncbi:MAG: peptidylprolyl isomerase [Planctomycetes bacterium]|nr:peptidylprolyl isomerase [Planctomycetota bacterium]